MNPMDREHLATRTDTLRVYVHI